MLDARETETAYRAIGLGSRFARPRPRKPTRGEQASKSNIPLLLQYITPKACLLLIFVFFGTILNNIEKANEKHYFAWCQLPLKVALRDPPRFAEVVLFVTLSLILVFGHHLENMEQRVKKMTLPGATCL